MSRSSGAGSPVWFHCSQRRRWEGRHLRHDKIVRTGRVRPYRPSRGTALGTRSMLEAHEYRCECGHVGWTNHITIRHFPIEGVQ